MATHSTTTVTEDAGQREIKETKETRETRARKKDTSLVVVELAHRRSPEQVRRLRKGRGRLVSDIDDVVEELVTAGTIKAETPPVVVVVREGASSLLWDEDDYDDDDDDDDYDDDDDEDEDD